MSRCVWVLGGSLVPSGTARDFGKVVRRESPSAKPFQTPSRRGRPNKPGCTVGPVPSDNKARGGGGGISWHLNCTWEISRFKLTAKFPTRNSGSSANLSHTSGTRCGLWQGGGGTQNPGGSAKLPTAKFTTANLIWRNPPPPPHPPHHHTIPRPCANPPHPTPPPHHTEALCQPPPPHPTPPPHHTEALCQPPPTPPPHHTEALCQPPPPPHHTEALCQPPPPTTPVEDNSFQPRFRTWPGVHRLHGPVSVDPPAQRAGPHVYDNGSTPVAWFCGEDGICPEGGPRTEWGRVVKGCPMPPPPPGGGTFVGLWVCEKSVVGGSLKSPPTPEPHPGKGKESSWLLEAPVRPCPADAHPSAHKSVLESANPRMDSECASGCPWSTARATARLWDGRPLE